MTKEETIKELRDASDSEVRYGDTENHYNEVLKRIEALDMAIKALEQEPRKGKWISKPHVYGVTYCSECDFELKIDDTNYCPNCGVEMESEDKYADSN